MKKIVSIIPFLVVALFHAQSLTNTENYIYSRTYLEPVTSEQPNAAQIQGVQYLDGLGKTTQSIAIKATPNGKDLVVPSIYDQSGKKTKEYLPQPVDTQNGAFVLGIGESSVNSFYGVPNAYSETLYEKSPLGRIEKTAAPGTDWQMSGTHTQKIEYLSNDANEVKKYKATTNWNASSQINDTSIAIASDDPYTTNGYYNANALYKMVSKDEDNNETHTFINSKKQSVLVRKINKKPNGATENLDTYYVYNEFDNLAYVIPPKASVPTLTSALLDQLCYQYKYDKYNRLVEKKIPGKGWEYLVYDKQNRLVASQDANLQTKGQWLYTKYDKFGRVAITGISTGYTRSTEQNEVDGLGLNNVNRLASPLFNRQGMDVYYDNPDTAYPNSTKWVTLLSLNYYDTYPAGSPSQPSQIQSQTTLASAPTTVVSNGLSSVRSTKTLPTATYTKNIENDSWSSAFIWYDTLGRIIGTHATNHLGGYTKTESELDFSGMPQKTVVYHARKADEQGVTIKQRYVYDSQKRLKQHYHQVDSKPEELLTENTYNELSQVINKKVGNNLQSIDYTYNIRGWMTDVNKNQMGLADLGGKLFAYNIKYNQKDGIDNPDPAQFSGKNVVPKYNGNIAEIDWRAVETIGINPSLTPKRYGYSYDSTNRILAGYYQNPNNPYSKENTESLDYDLNGNISSLYRTSVTEYGSNTATVIDNLNYAYTGNQAININDASQNFAGYEGGGAAIGYDANGNMVNMPDKGISSMKYNYLNLPTSMMVSRNGNENITISTQYSADGTRLRKENITSITGFNGTTVSKKITDYLDGFQYLKTENQNSGGGSSEMLMASSLSRRAMQPMAFSLVPTLPDPTIDPPFGGGGIILDLKTPDLQFFPTAEGFYDYAKDQYIYQYADQLGNVRVSYGRNSAGVLEITDNNDYYPFGMNHLKTGTAFFGQGSYKNRKYNGKELQETGMYSYGWREYMPDLGRWNGIDQLAEDYFSASPYAYVLNNPINMFDPDGRATAPWTAMWDATPDGTNSYWYNNGSGFTSYEGGPKGGGGGGSLASGSTVSFGGMFTMGDGVYTLPPLVLSGSSFFWGLQAQNHYNSFMSGLNAKSDFAWDRTSNAGRYNDGGVMMIGGTGDPLGLYDIAGQYLSTLEPENQYLAMGIGLFAAIATKKPGLIKAETGIVNAEINVVRGGTCLACQFENGSGVIVDAKGLLNGVSVNSTKGLSIRDLSAGIPNGKIGTTTVSQIEALGGENYRLSN